MGYDPTNWAHGDLIIANKLNKIETALSNISDNAVFDTDGLSPIGYVNAGDPMPSNPKKGAAVFVKDGSDFLIYSFDGTDWQLRVDPKLNERIEQVLSDAKNNTAQVISENNQKINDTIDEVTKEKIELALKDADFNKNAQELADKALADAKANTAEAVKETLDSANKNIDDAKTSLTSDLQKEISDRTSAVSSLDTKAQGYANDAKKSVSDDLAKEVSDRNTAVSALDTKAQGYANTAKQDAINAATTADGTINKKIDDTASSLTSTISQNKTDADGKISTAQSTAKQALDGLITKVSQTDYDKKTSDLTTQLNTTTTTANQSKQDIVDIKSTNSSQDSKINSIVSDATKTAQTISDIQKTDSSQSDKINSIVTDVNGTKQSITDIQTKDSQQDTRMGTIETSVSGVKSDFSTYKTSNDGAVKTAQTTAQTAVDGLKNKVSQTDYNTKTGQLQTDLTATTQTANQAKTDIVSIKQTDTSQDARMTQIESDASGVKTTVSDLKTAQGKQSGDISTLQQRADGFDATVTKVNNLAVGGRNLLINTSNAQSGYLIKFANTPVASGTTQKITFPSVGETCITKSATGETYYRFNVPTSGNMVNIVAGKSYTFSADIMGNVPYLALRHQNQSGGASWTGDFKGDLGVTTTYKRVSVTFTVPSNATGFYLSLQAYSDSALTNTAITDSQYFSFKRVKFEEGTIATSYEYAPEDADSTTAKAQLTADNATLSINNYKADADGRISKAQSDITQTAKDVTTKVSQTDYDKKTGDLSTSVSKAQQTADSAVTTIGNYKTSNDNRVQSAETKIAQNTTDITLRATTSDLNDAKSDYNSQIAQVKIDTNAVTTSVANINTKVDGLKFSNINMLDNSGFEMPLSSTTGTISVVDGSNSTRPTPFGKSMALIDNIGNAVANDLYGTFTLNNKITLKANTQYTISYYYSVAGTAGYQHSDYALDANGKVIFGIAAEHVATDVTGGQMVWKRFVKTFTPTTDTVISGMRIGFVSQVDGRGWKVVDNIQIEVGNKATDYSPSPYDNDYKIATQQITIDGITDTVSNQGTNIDLVTKRVTTAEGSLSTATNNIAGLQSSVTQTSNQIKTEITDRANGDSNTLQSSKDFTTSSITSAVNGVNSTITQTSDSLIAKINTKTDSDTVLSLLKNNWSIGITDNIGKISNGIAADSTSMNVISKKVVIDSPETQINGTAWINSAMIKNASIQTINIADAAITSAKIAQLDVAKLTGDVTSFVKSYWNSAYGNVTIKPENVSLQSYSGSTLITQLDIGNMGISIKMPGVSSFLSNTLINANGMSFQHNNGSYATVGVMDAGFSLENNTYGGSPMSIRIGDGVNNVADSMAFAITASQSYGTSPQLIWAGSKVGKITTAYRTWDNPHGFILADDIKFSTWDNTASTVIFDETINYQNWSPNQTYGYIDSTGTKRWFKVSGYNMSSTNRLVGIFGGDGANGIAFDQTGDVWFSDKGKSYSLHDMLAKLNML